MLREELYERFKQLLIENDVVIKDESDEEFLKSSFLDDSLSLSEIQGLSESILLAITEAEVIQKIFKTLNDIELKSKKKSKKVTQSGSEEVPVEVVLSRQQLMSKCSVTEYMAETYSDNSKVRKEGLRSLCPCRVKSNVSEFWDRIKEMVDDPEPAVRYQAMHNLCDGSPKEMEETVIELLEKLHNDPDKNIRRQCHRVLTHYRKTGKWNIL